jgi:hypothetical protein
VHDVAATRRALAVVEEWQRAADGAGDDELAPDRGGSGSGRAGRGEG